MSETAAGEERLNELHVIVADALIDQLTNGEPVMNEEGVVVATKLDPRVIASAITFLNNNKIVANPFLSEKMSEIAEQLQSRRKRFKVVKPDEAAERAAANS